MVAVLIKLDSRGRLFQEGGISQEERDSAQAAHDSAVAQLEAAQAGVGAAEATLEIARALVTAAEAQVRQKQAALDQAQVDLDHTFILLGPSLDLANARTGIDPRVAPPPGRYLDARDTINRSSSVSDGIASIRRNRGTRPATASGGTQKRFL